MSQRHTEMTLAACKTDNSRKAGGDDYIRGAEAGPEPPLSPSSTGQNPVSRAPLFAAACPLLPFELQPCLYGSLAASRVEIQVPLPPKQSNVQFAHKEQCVLTRKFPFILYGTVSGLGGEDRMRMKRVYVGTFTLECAQQQGHLIGSASEGGVFLFCLLNEKACFRQ